MALEFNFVLPYIKCITATVLICLGIHFTILLLLLIFLQDFSVSFT